ncbi:hypothetical protein GCM10028801_30420 [Nocardioides maradonensis]
MRRKVVVKSLPTQKVVKRDVSKLTPGYHWHICSDQDCRKVFLDECTTPEVNGRCDVCKRGHDTPYMEWRYPKNCCRGNTELLDMKSDWARYGRLAGNAPWFKCRTCHRCHGKPIT